MGVAAELGKAVEGGASDADAAGVAVVDEDRGGARLRMNVRGQTADVPAIAHGDQGEDGDLRMLGRVQRAEERLEWQILGERAGVELEPESLRGEAAGRQLEADEVHLGVV